MYKELTATELADELERVRLFSPELTGPLAMLDEASLGWPRRYPQLAEPQRAFSQARHAQWPRTRSEETWRQVVATASALAGALRELGDIDLERCTEQAGWGTCGLTLSEDGQCSAAQEHLAPTVEPGSVR
ncbi:hypothetical protein [Streptomyces nigrescens]|uniref:hypothetical protein n=1 Tax=Streptomyces nigrescens TaxID=1920 RepID=UPI0036FA0141